jgi:hypothetical protein
MENWNGCESGSGDTQKIRASTVSNNSFVGSGQRSFAMSERLAPAQPFFFFFLMSNFLKPNYDFSFELNNIG